MNPKRQSLRAALLLTLLSVVLALYCLRLMQMQVVDGEKIMAEIERGSTTEQVIKAARGEILDRNGRPLASNTIGRDVVINQAYMERGTTNQTILRLIGIMEEANEDWIDNLPITEQEPFAFKEGDVYEASIARLKDALGVAQYATIDDVMSHLIENYGLEDLSPLDARRVAGVRYEMDQRGFSASVPYTFATDIKIETIPKIKERSFEIPGVDVVESTIRQYVAGDVAPHLVGTTGPIYKPQWDEAEKVKNPDNSISAVIGEKTYQMNDQIGKSGAELAFEGYLKGTDGTRRITTNAAGDVIEVAEEHEPVPGNTVVTTIDSRLQKVAQDALESNIKMLQETKKPGRGQEAEAGAAVVVDVNTGELLAAATYPSYNLATYQRDYDQLAATEGEPLFNRALSAAYTPGSSFKPMVAAAALAEGVITPETMYNCTHIYGRFTNVGYSPQCEGYHGMLDVVTALRYSCNIFFYEAGYYLGIDKIDEYGALFGFGQPTGIELAENIGQVASPEVKAASPAYADDPAWRPGDVIQAAIGQQATTISPLQLANYTAAIANGGKRMKVTMLKSVKSYTLDETVYEHEPQVAQLIDEPEAIKIVQEGMVAASHIGTAAGTFANYPITVGSKTGTPERGDGLCNAVFIAYAPAEDPEIAVAVVVEKGWEGYQIAPVAREIFDAYFFTQGDAASGGSGYGTLAP